MPVSSLFKSVGGNRQQAADAVDDKPDRVVAAHDDHARRPVRCDVRQMQQSPQADDRHHDAAKIGQSEQARRHERHMGQIRRPDDFGDDVKTQTEGLPRKLEHQEIFEYRISIWRDKRSTSVERSVFFRVCSRLLAIATLNGFGQRGNLFDSRCEIFRTPRLLLGSSRGLG